MIYFVVVNYYSTELISQLIQSVQRNVDIYYKIIIINNSVDDTSIYQFKSDVVFIIDAGQNLGFGKGCNLGIQYVFARDRQALIWLINPDAVIEPNAVSYVEHSFSYEPRIAILGTRIKNTEGKIWFSSGNFNPSTGYLKHESIASDINDLRFGVTVCRWVSGCSLIVNLERFDHCPSFDPHYFLYCEDADLCERYYRQGYMIAVTNAALVTHKVSAISSRDRYSMFEYFTYSKLYFLHQHGTRFALLLYLLYVPIIFILLLIFDYRGAIGRIHGYQKFLQWVVSKR